MKIMKDYSESEIRSALSDAIGDVSETAEQLQVLFGELWTYIRQRRDLLDIVQQQTQFLVEDAEAVLHEAVDHEKRWAIVFTLRTLGKKQGWGKVPAQPVQLLPLKAPDDRDESRLEPDELVRYRFLFDKAAGYENGIRLPDPEWVQRLDREIDAVRTAFSKHRGQTRRTAAQLGVTYEQLQEYLGLRPRLYEAVGDPREQLVCRAVQGLSNAVAAKKSWAVMLVLETQGRALGYSRNPYDEVGRKPPTAPHAYDWARLTPDELCEVDELDHKVRGVPLPQYKIWEKRLREIDAKLAAEKEKKARAQ